MALMNLAEFWDKIVAYISSKLGTDTTQYYLSSSSSELADGEWSDSYTETPTGKYLWTRVKTVLDNGKISYSIPVLVGGSNGYSSIEVKLYTWAESTPIKLRQRVRYNLTSNYLCGINSSLRITNINGWYTYIPETTDENLSLYQISALVYSKDTYDTIEPEDWSEPLKISGYRGKSGITNINLNLYQRSVEQPKILSNSIDYDFTNIGTEEAIDGDLEGWSLTIPDGGDTCWITSVIINTDDISTTYTIEPEDWSEPVIFTETSYTHIKYSKYSTGYDSDDNPDMSDSPFDGAIYIGVLSNNLVEASSIPSDYNWSRYVGEDGNTGYSNAVVHLYKWATETPNNYQGNDLIYTFATASFADGEPDVTNANAVADETNAERTERYLDGWDFTIGTSPGNDYQIYEIIAVAFSDSDTDIIYTEDWSAPVILSSSGAQGESGKSYITLTLFKRSTSTPTSSELPDTTTVGGSPIYYNFDTGEISGDTKEWSISIPSGIYPCWAISGIAYGRSGVSNYISKWTTPVVAYKNGEDSILATIDQTSVTSIAKDDSYSPNNITFSFYTIDSNGKNEDNYYYTMDYYDGSQWYKSYEKSSSKVSSKTISISELKNTYSSATIFQCNIWSGNPEESESIILDSESVTIVEGGFSRATVMMYKWSQTIPTDNPGTVTYVFETGNVTGANEGWYNSIQTQPSSSYSLYMVSGIAVSQSNSDTISEWTNPIQWDAKDGESPVTYSIEPSSNIIIYNPNNSSYNPSSVSFSFYSIIGNTKSDFTNGYYRIIGSNDSSSFITSGSNFIGGKIPDNNIVTLSNYNYKYYRCYLYTESEYTDIIDYESINIIDSGVDGEKGETGASGTDAIYPILKNENQTIILDKDSGKTLAQTINIPYSMQKGLQELSYGTSIDNYTVSISIDSNIFSYTNSDKEIKLTVKEDQDIDTIGTIPITFTYYSGNSDTTTYIKYFSWSTVKDGVGGLSITVGNLSQDIVCNNNGYVYTNQIVTIPIEAYYGIDKLESITASFTPSEGFLYNSSSGTQTVSVLDNIEFTVPTTYGGSLNSLGGTSINSGSFDILINTSYGSVTKTFRWAKVKNGATGDSVTILSTSVDYQVSSSDTSEPTGEWVSSIPSVPKGQYLWTRTIVTYSTGTSTTSYSVGYHGSNGYGIEAYSTLNEMFQGEAEVGDLGLVDGKVYRRTGTELDFSNFKFSNLATGTSSSWVSGSVGQYGHKLGVVTYEEGESYYIRAKAMYTTTDVTPTSLDLYVQSGNGNPVSIWNSSLKADASHTFSGIFTPNAKYTMTNASVHIYTFPSGASGVTTSVKGLIVLKLSDYPLLLTALARQGITTNSQICAWLDTYLPYIEDGEEWTVGGVAEQLMSSVNLGSTVSFVTSGDDYVDVISASIAQYTTARLYSQGTAKGDYVYSSIKLRNMDTTPTGTLRLALRSEGGTTLASNVLNLEDTTDKVTTAYALGLDESNSTTNDQLYLCLTSVSKAVRVYVGGYYGSTTFSTNSPMYINLTQSGWLAYLSLALATTNITTIADWINANITPFEGTASLPLVNWEEVSTLVKASLTLETPEPWTINARGFNAENYTLVYKAKTTGVSSSATYTWTVNNVVQDETSDTLTLSILSTETTSYLNVAVSVIDLYGEEQTETSSITAIQMEGQGWEYLGILTSEDLQDNTKMIPSDPYTPTGGYINNDCYLYVYTIDDKEYCIPYGYTEGNWIIIANNTSFGNDTSSMLGAMISDIFVEGREVDGAQNIALEFIEQLIAKDAFISNLTSTKAFIDYIETQDIKSSNFNGLSEVTTDGINYKYTQNGYALFNDDGAIYSAKSSFYDSFIYGGNIVNAKIYGNFEAPGFETTSRSTDVIIDSIGTNNTYYNIYDMLGNVNLDQQYGDGLLYTIVYNDSNYSGIFVGDGTSSAKYTIFPTVNKTWAETTLNNTVNYTQVNSSQQKTEKRQYTLWSKKTAYNNIISINSSMKVISSGKLYILLSFYTGVKWTSGSGSLIITKSDGTVKTTSIIVKDVDTETDSDGNTNTYWYRITYKIDGTYVDEGDIIQVKINASSGWNWSSSGYSIYTGYGTNYWYVKSDFNQITSSDTIYLIGNIDNNNQHEIKQLSSNLFINSYIKNTESLTIKDYSDEESNSENYLWYIKDDEFLDALIDEYKSKSISDKYPEGITPVGNMSFDTTAVNVLSLATWGSDNIAAEINVTQCTFTDDSFSWGNITFNYGSYSKYTSAFVTFTSMSQYEGAYVSNLIPKADGGLLGLAQNKWGTIYTDKLTGCWGNTPTVGSGNNQDGIINDSEGDISQERPAVIVDSWKSSDGTGWYRLWSDGFLEQGGIYTKSSRSRNGGTNVTLYKAYKSNDYHVTVTGSNERDYTGYYMMSVGVLRDETSIYFGSYGSGSDDKCIYLTWKTEGFAEEE